MTLRGFDEYTVNLYGWSPTAVYEVVNVSLHSCGLGPGASLRAGISIGDIVTLVDGQVCAYTLVLVSASNNKKITDLDPIVFHEFSISV